ncbi:hypothetical protein H0N95_00355 [Candidatus Micrarchaeota archaeon]|nr:hypothetical protein [Candidatus Micrarchaeota archaeon]
MGLGSFLVERQKRKVERGLVSKVGGKGAVSAYDTLSKFNRSKRMARKITERFRIKPVKAVEVLDTKEKYKKATEEIQKTKARELAKAQESTKEEGLMKKEETQKAVRYSVQSAALEEMIKGEMEFEARGFNSKGFPVSKKGLNDVNGLIKDFDGGLYPKVVVMTDLVIENKKGLIEREPLKLNFLEKLHRNKYTGPVLAKISSLL